MSSAGRRRREAGWHPTSRARSTGSCRRRSPTPQSMPTRPTWRSGMARHMTAVEVVVQKGRRPRVRPRGCVRRDSGSPGCGNGRSWSAAVFRGGRGGGQGHDDPRRAAAQERLARLRGNYNTALSDPPDEGPPPETARFSIGKEDSKSPTRRATHDVPPDNTSRPDFYNSRKRKTPLNNAFREELKRTKNVEAELHHVEDDFRDMPVPRAWITFTSSR